MSWCRETSSDGTIVLTLCVLARPGARRSEIAGVHGDAIRIRVAAPPVEGKANAELLRFLAVEFGVPLRQVRLVRGDTARHKVVRVTAPVSRPDRAWSQEAHEP